MSKLTKDQRDLPNIHGYEFIGIDKDGNERECVVLRDQETSCRYVDGGFKYYELYRWRVIDANQNKA